MKLKHLIALVLTIGIAAGCVTYSGPEWSLNKLTYNTKHTLQIYNNTSFPIYQEEVEEITSAVIESFGGMMSPMADYKILIVGRVIPIRKWGTSEYMYVTGMINSLDKIITITAKPKQCLAKTKLIHELQHIYHLLISPIKDIWHDDIKYWSRMKQIEKRIQASLCKEEVRILP